MSQDERVNILIVDDRQENLVAARAVLEDLGQEILCARSGREALRYLLHHEVAVILLDVNMPEMDGFETASLIRERDAMKHTPIIFLTAADHEIQRLKGYAVGAVDYVLNPVQPEVLRSKVAVFVELARKNREVTSQATALARLAAQLQRLAKASMSIHRAITIEAILDAMTDAARDVIGSHEALAEVSLAAPRRAGARKLVRVSLSAKQSEWEREDASLDATARLIANLTADAVRPVRFAQDELERRLAVAYAQTGVAPADHLPLRGFLAARLTGNDGEVFGILAVSDKRDGELTDDDEAIIVQLAQLGSIAVQNWLYSEAKEANRIKDEFLGTLSHELRTPLHAILGWTRHLRTGGAAADLAHGLEVIERNVKAQARLVEDLLDVSRITSGKMRIDAKPVRLAGVVEDALEAHKRAALTKEIEIVATASGDAVVVLGDADRLRQVISNLLANAVKFTPPRGRISIALRAHDGVQEIEVSDDGDGISRDLLPFVFERFRQGDTSTRRQRSGLGLGLAIVRHIVELHGGTVEVESAGLGKGSRFLVRLPAHAMDATRPAGDSAVERPSVPPRAGSNGDSRLSGVRVLVVDGDADAREMLGKALARERAEVTAVASVGEAMTVFAERTPHVVVTELVLPERDGFDLIRTIRSRPVSDGGALPALALTASAREEDKARAIAAGFQMHAAKPIEPGALVRAVEELTRGGGIPNREVNVS